MMKIKEAKKKRKPNAKTTCLLAHIVPKGSSSKKWDYNDKISWRRSKENTDYVTPDNIAKEGIKTFKKLVDCD